VTIPVPLNKFPLVEILIGEGVPSKSMLLAVTPVPTIQVASIHMQGTFTFFLIVQPTSAVMVAIVITILTFPLTKSLSPTALVLVLIAIFHVARSTFIVVLPTSIIYSLGGHHLAYMMEEVPLPVFRPFLKVP
jgi:hypothetical protein